MLAQRVAVATVGVPILAAVLVWGGAMGIALLVAAIVLVAGWETFRLLQRAGYPGLTWLGTTISLVLVLDAASLTAGDGAAWLLLAGGAVLGAIGAFARRDPREGLAVWQSTVFGGLYVGLLSFLPRIMAVAPALRLDAPLAPYLDGPRWWLVICVLAVWSYDTAAYLAGRRFGGPRFMTNVSPAKTWAGAIGGLVTATVVSAALLTGVGRSAWEAALLGPLVAASAQAGDLAESMLKRAAGAKDSSSLLPGHGGMLDRIDSFLFAAPAVYFFVVAVVR